MAEAFGECAGGEGVVVLGDEQEVRTGVAANHEDTVADETERGNVERRDVLDL